MFTYKIYFKTENKMGLWHRLNIERIWDRGTIDLDNRDKWRVHNNHSWSFGHSQNHARYLQEDWRHLDSGVTCSPSISPFIGDCGGERGLSGGRSSSSKFCCNSSNFFILICWSGSWSCCSCSSGTSWHRL